VEQLADIAFHLLAVPLSRVQFADRGRDDVAVAPDEVERRPVAVAGAQSAAPS
jgi:hypothetical protein